MGRLTLHLVPAVGTEPEGEAGGGAEKEEEKKKEREPKRESRELSLPFSVVVVILHCQFFVVAQPRPPRH